MNIDMHELLDVATSDQPPPRDTVDHVVAAGRRRTRRALAQRTGVLGGVVAVAVAAALVWQSAVPRAGAGDRAPIAADRPGGGPAFVTTFAGYAVGDFRVGAPAQVTPGYQTATVFHDNMVVGEGDPITRQVGSLSVYRPGAFRPEVFQHGTALTVNGRPAFQAEISYTVNQLDRRTGTGTPTPVPHVDVAIAWQYADDAWAVIRGGTAPGFDVPAATLLRLAERFAPGTSAAVKVPYTAGYLPAGWALASAGPHLPIDNEDGSTISWVAFTRSGVSFTGLTEPVDLLGVPSLSIVVGRRGTENPVSTPCPPGEHFCQYPITGTDYYVEVVSGALPADELANIAEHLVFDDLTRPDTWHDAAGL
ncbi:hypothetical protein [Dactylosporangium sp. CA-092794]|uniref:hypothetical protein n=1 Tax=Dactylosporangium sp. CA-092794 TaxID=3239929 RepID=UPI003D8F6433